MVGFDITITYGCRRSHCLLINGISEDFCISASLGQNSNNSITCVSFFFALLFLFIESGSKGISMHIPPNNSNSCEYACVSSTLVVHKVLTEDHSINGQTGFVCGPCPELPSVPWFLIPGAPTPEPTASSTLTASSPPTVGVVVPVPEEPVPEEPVPEEPAPEEAAGKSKGSSAEILPAKSEDKR